MQSTSSHLQPHRLLANLRGLLITEPRLRDFTSACMGIPRLDLRSDFVVIKLFTIINFHQKVIKPCRDQIVPLKNFCYENRYNPSAIYTAAQPVFYPSYFQEYYIL